MLVVQQMDRKIVYVNVVGFFINNFSLLKMRFEGQKFARNTNEEKKTKKYKNVFRLFMHNFSLLKMRFGE